MPGVDFDRLRAEISMRQVLDLLGFQPSRQSGDQWCGPCPLHEAGRDRCCFSANVATDRYFCHRCRSHGNQLELWAAAVNLPLQPAAINLCKALSRTVPWIRRW